MNTIHPSRFFFPFTTSNPDTLTSLLPLINIYVSDRSIIRNLRQNINIRFKHHELEIVIESRAYCMAGAHT